jgi:Na+/melibiose symporter-like transporter
MEILAAVWLLVAVCTMVIASRKGRNALGWFVLGAIFGVFALILVAVLGPADQPASSLTAQLEELDQLKERGIITEPEYERKKASLLS